MTSHSNNGRKNIARKSLLSRAKAPYFIITIGLICTLSATFYAAQSTTKTSKAKLENKIDTILLNIQSKIDTNIAVLRGTAGLLSSSPKVTREQFHAYVERLELKQHYPGIQGVGFTLRIDPEDINGLLSFMREQQVDNFRIWPNHDNKERHSIIFLEPEDKRNLAAIGFDMFSEPTRRVAMERARDTAQPAASGKVTLVQEIDQSSRQAGFLVYLPIYDAPDIPASVELRRRLLRGFVYSPIRADDLLHHVIDPRDEESIDIFVFDKEASNLDQLLHRSDRLRPHPSLLPSFTATRSIVVAGRPWTVAFLVRGALISNSERNLAPYIFFSGILVTLLLFGIARTQAKAQLTAEAIATKLRRSEKVLREEAKVLETLNDINVSLAAELDLKKLVQAVTDAARELVGAQYAAFFFSQLDERGESYKLYAISGIPREAFKDVPMPRITPLFEPTFRGEEVVRVGNIKNDPRFGKNKPYNGLPANHIPVCSYLAVPVVSRAGKVLGGLFFSHNEEDKFIEKHERIVLGIAAQAAIAIDNATLFQEAQKEIIERAKVEQELRRHESHLEQLVSERTAELQELSSHLQSVREEEKAMIAREIHDELGGRLIALKMDISWLQPKLPPNPALQKKAETMAQALDDAMDTLRRIQTTLRPSILDNLGLVAALDWQAQEFQKRTGIECKFSSSHGEITVDHAQSITLFRFFQESLSNIARHANATRVTASLSRTEKVIKLQVADNGVGITLEKAFDPARHGIRGMFERARHLNGEIRIDSNTPSGTIITAQLPLSS